MVAYRYASNILGVFYRGLMSAERQHHNPIYGPTIIMTAGECQGIFKKRPFSL